MEPDGAVADDGAAPPRRRVDRRLQPLSLVVAVLWVLADQLSKHWAVNRLSNDRIVESIGSLQFNLSYNSGMAFGKGKGFGPVLGVIALVVVVVVLVGLRTGAGRWNAIAVGMVLGGAAGNLTDRLFRGDAWLRGSVVDFIDLQWWPVFNIADVGVTVGGIMLVLGTLFVGSARHGGAAAGEG